MSNYRTRINKALLSALRAIAHDGVDPIHKVKLHEIKSYLLYDFPNFTGAQQALKKIEAMEKLHKNSTA